MLPVPMEPGPPGTSLRRRRFRSLEFVVRSHSHEHTHLRTHLPLRQRQNEYVPRPRAKHVVPQQFGNGPVHERIQCARRAGRRDPEKGSQHIRPRRYIRDAPAVERDFQPPQLPSPHRHLLQPGQKSESLDAGIPARAKTQLPQISHEDIGKPKPDHIIPEPPLHAQLGPMMPCSR